MFNYILQARESLSLRKDISLKNAVVDSANELVFDVDFVVILVLGT